MSVCFLGRDTWTETWGGIFSAGLGCNSYCASLISFWWHTSNTIHQLCRHVTILPSLELAAFWSQTKEISRLSCIVRHVGLMNQNGSWCCATAVPLHPGLIILIPAFAVSPGTFEMSLTFMRTHQSLTGFQWPLKEAIISSSTAHCSASRLHPPRHSSLLADGNCLNWSCL